ncbi:MAG: winged helix-turn-helix domain-containing protein [Pseudomonadota bacterium]
MSVAPRQIGRPPTAMGHNDPKGPCVAGSKPTPFMVGPWRVDPAARALTNGEHVKHVSPRALGVLTALADAQGDVVPRRTLLHKVWPEVIVTDESLTQAVAELRRAFGQRRGSAPVVETVHKAGYRVVLPVERVSEPHGGLHHTTAASREAHLLYLEARQETLECGLDGLERSHGLLEEAVALSPEFAPALAELSLALVAMALYRGSSGSQLADAVHLADEAVRMRPDISASHAARGFALGACGAHDKAWDSFSKAFSTDPNDAHAYFNASRIALMGRDYKGATLLALRAASLTAEEGPALFLAARAASALDEPERSRYLPSCLRRLLRSADRCPQSVTFRDAMTTTALALAGEHEEAQRRLSSVGAEATTTRYYNLLTKVLLGKTSDALDDLEETIESGWRDNDYLQADPVLAPLHANSRFGRMTRQLAA